MKYPATNWLKCKENRKRGSKVEKVNGKYISRNRRKKSTLLSTYRKSVKKEIPCFGMCPSFHS